jgi:hypothetical protein
VYGEEFAPMVDRARSSGWEFINEGGPKKPKWGFISTAPGVWRWWGVRGRQRKVTRAAPCCRALAWSLLLQTQQTPTPAAALRSTPAHPPASKPHPTSAGSVLHMVINSTRQSGGKDERTNVMIAYLKSYEKMGKAKFE